MTIDSKDLSNLRYESYPTIFDKFRKLSLENGNLPMENVMSAFSRVGSGFAQTQNPYIQNRRVKRISSLPADYTKDKVADMLTSPYENETPLRQVAHALEYTAYPIYHIRKTYQALLTYHSYIVPKLPSTEELKKADFIRSWRLLELLRAEINPRDTAHRIAGQVAVEGKVFYTPRVSVDKSHGTVNHAFLQQLPSDWCKIVGFNNISKYTVAFNLMYFTQPGCVPEQFGDLFSMYMDDFGSVLSEAPKGTGKTLVYASDTGIDLRRLGNINQIRKMAGSPNAYYQNGKWFYWVTLPVDKVFTFESDDVSATAISPFSGIFINMIQLAQMEQIQLSIIQNPLVSCLIGEIPYRDAKESTADDQYRLSNAGRTFFETLWYDMMAQANTSGIGVYSAPFQNMKLETLSEAPNAMDIVTKGYSDTMAQAGLSALLPVSDDPKVGISQISLQLESKAFDSVYRCYERMMKSIINELHLPYRFEFKMFGDLATDKEQLERCMKGMEHGILPDVIMYNALLDRSVLDDISLSDAIIESGIMDRRIPLVSSYNMRSTDNEGGRPKGDGQITSEGSEANIDTYGETND